MNGVDTRFPDVPRSRLEAMAREHAALVELEYDDLGRHDNAPTDRLVVNFLRHECTDYDADQTAARHRAACEAIAARYPWLDDECRSQIARRARSDAEEADLLRAYAEHQAQMRTERAELIAASRQAAKKFTPGERVRFVDRQWTRDAVVVKVGRSRVTVSYRLKSGQDREKAVYAAHVEVIE